MRLSASSASGLARPRARAAGTLVGEMESLGFAEDEDEYRRAFLFEE